MRPTAAQVADTMEAHGFKLPALTGSLLRRRARAVDVPPAGLADFLSDWLSTPGAASVVGAAETEIDLDRLLQDMPEIADLLDVQDDGVGLAATTTRPGGGVGLDSARRRAARIGGQLAVTSLDRGTLVRLRFPRHAPPVD
mgnify:CR=1 FL=1